MSNLNAVRKWYETLNFEECLAEDVRFEVMEGFLEAGEYHGREEVAAMFERYMKNFSEFEAVTEQFIDGGEAITAFGRYRGVLEKNAAAFEIPFCHIWFLEEGKIKDMRHFVNTLLMHTALSQERQ